MFSPGQLKLILLFAFLLPVPCFGQKQKIDSLEKALLTAAEDSAKIRLLDKLAFLYSKSDPVKADSTAKKEMELALRLKDKKGIAGAYLNEGTVNYRIGKNDTAKFELENSLKLFEELNDRSGIGSVMLVMGGLLQSEGDYKKALECFIRVNKIGEETGNKQLIARSTHNIGLVYMEQGTYKLALDYFEKALKIKEEIGDKRSQYSTTANIGITYIHLHDTVKAEEFIKRGLKIAEEAGSKRDVASSLENLANIYVIQNKFPLALENYKRSMKLKVELNDLKGEASGLSNIGECYRSLGKYDSAVVNQKKAVAILEKLGEKYSLQNIYQMLSQTYESKGDFRSSLEYLNKHIKLKDSIFNDDNSKLIAEMQAKYDSEKKQREIELLKKDDAMQKLFRNSLMIGAGLLFVLAVVMLISYGQKRKANKELSGKNKIIEEGSARLQIAFAEIEEKNKDITDSIIYAKRIQDAILPSVSSIEKNLPNSFVLFKPRDIVSGDFYWSARVGNKIVLAVADCTGHGVPGAFMSMIGNTLLNEIVNVKGILKPSEILEQLDLGIKNALQNDGSEKSSDGMDIAVCTIESGRRAEFSGALRPLLLLRKKEMKETKGDKRSIGAHDIASPFTNHIIDLEKGDSIYLFSDGYADQFGGDKGKKMMRKNFNELILKYSHLSMKEQAKVLEKQLMDWKGNYEQVDDVCVIGLRV